MSFRGTRCHYATADDLMRLDRMILGHPTQFCGLVDAHEKAIAQLVTWNEMTRM